MTIYYYIIAKRSEIKPMTKTDEKGGVKRFTKIAMNYTWQQLEETISALHKQMMINKSIGIRINTVARDRADQINCGQLGIGII